MRVSLLVTGIVLLAGCGSSSGAEPSAAGATPATLPPVAAASPVVLSNPSAVLASATVAPTGAVTGSTAESLLAGISAEEIEGLGGLECATELAHFAVAGERYEARTGVFAETFEDLAGDLDVEPRLWAFDEAAGQLIPAPGSGCQDIFGQQARDQAARACQVQQKTLETAVEATYAQTGESPRDQQQLVDDDMMTGIVDDFEIVDGEVVVVAGTECEQQLAALAERNAEHAATPVSDAEACVVSRRTMETAVEAFWAQNGALPLTEKELVDGGMLAAEFPDYDLAADAVVVVAPGSICT